MVEELGIDIFASPAMTLVNPVNCVGVMGAGLALEFRKRYPDMYGHYRDICADNLLEPGKLWLWRRRWPWVLNFPTKTHWRKPSRKDFIVLGLEELIAQYQGRGITSIAFPRLGCGHGGLDWEVVRPLILRAAEQMDIPVYIHSV